MGMNEEIQNRPLCDFEWWFFQKLFILLTLYNRNPWLIPKKSLVYEDTFFDDQEPVEIQTLQEEEGRAFTLIIEKMKQLNIESASSGLSRSEIQDFVAKKYKQKGKEGLSRDDINCIIRYETDKEKKEKEQEEKKKKKKIS
jgi:hypothetical protein